MSCSMSRIDRSFSSRRRPTSAVKSRDSFGFMPAVGSSSSSRAGRQAKGARHLEPPLVA
jgi:hypothetical protein